MRDFIIVVLKKWENTRANMSLTMFHHAPVVSCVDGIDLFSPKFNVVPPRGKREHFLPLQSR